MNPECPDQDLAKTKPFRQGIPILRQNRQAVSNKSRVEYFLSFNLIQTLLKITTYIGFLKFQFKRNPPPSHKPQRPALQNHVAIADYFHGHHSPLDTDQNYLESGVGHYVFNH